MWGKESLYASEGLKTSKNLSGSRSWGCAGDGAEPTWGLCKGQLQNSTWGPRETTQIKLFWADLPEPADGPNPWQGVISILDLRVYTVQHISHGQHQCWQWNAAGKCAFEAVPEQWEHLRERTPAALQELGRLMQNLILGGPCTAGVQLLRATLLPSLRNLELSK